VNCAFTQALQDAAVPEDCALESSIVGQHRDYGVAVAGVTDLGGIFGALFDERLRFCGSAIVNCGFVSGFQ
jgi:hypothetical protein